MRTRQPLEQLCILLMVSSAVCGCTVVGYGIGAAIDAGNPRSFELQHIEEKIRRGQRIKLRLKDGTDVSGKYLGAEGVRSPEYVVRYEKARQALATELPLPALGDSVAVFLARGEKRIGEFRGFDQDWILVTGAEETVRLSLADISGLADRDGHIVSGAMLAGAIAARQVPSQYWRLTGMALELSPPPGGARIVERQVISLDRIAFIEQRSHTGRTVGMIVGGVIDAAALIALMICASTDCLNVGF